MFHSPSYWVEINAQNFMESDEMEGSSSTTHFIFLTSHWDRQSQYIFLCNAGTNIENNDEELFFKEIFSSYYNWLT